MLSLESRKFRNSLATFYALLKILGADQALAEQTTKDVKYLPPHHTVEVIQDMAKDIDLVGESFVIILDLKYKFKTYFKQSQTEGEVSQDIVKNILHEINSDGIKISEAKVVYTVHNHPASLFIKKLFLLGVDTKITKPNELLFGPSLDYISNDCSDLVNSNNQIHLTVEPGGVWFCKIRNKEKLDSARRDHKLVARSMDIKRKILSLTQQNHKNSKNELNKEIENLMSFFLKEFGVALYFVHGAPDLDQLEDISNVLVTDR